MEFSDIEIANIARNAHDINRAYSQAIGDYSHVAWSASSEKLQASAISGVRHLISNLDASPEETHACWMKYKMTEGWVYGSVKDEAQKTHPCLVAYTDLPDHERAKDYLFRAVVLGAVRARIEQE